MKNMTSGNIAKIIILFTIPLVLGNIFQQLYNIADSKIVSSFVGTEAFAAVGSTAAVSNMIIGFINGFTQGFGILVANGFGAKDERRIRRNVAGSIVIFTFLTLFLYIMAFVGIAPALKALNTPEEIMGLSLTYVRIILGGMIFVSLYNLSANILRSVGDSKTPLFCLLLSVVLNVGLDLLFVGLFRWGIVGAAAATITSQGLCAGVCIIYAWTHFRTIFPKREDWRLTAKEYGNLFFSGLSMGLMGCIVNIGTIILQSAINGLGTSIIAAHTAGRKVFDLSCILIFTFGNTMTTFVSQNMGAGEIGRVKRGVKTAMLITFCIYLFLLTIMVLLPTARPLVSWIASTNDENIIQNAAMYARVGVSFYVILGPLFIFRCSLQGMGYRVMPLVTSVMEFLIKIASVALLVPRIGYTGVMFTEPISWFVMDIFLVIGYITAIRKVGNRISS